MSVSVHILSDLHLEFKAYQPAIDADIIVLAGDIDVGTKGLQWAREKFPESEIVYIAGNHEFYHYNYHELLQKFRQESEQYRIHFLENDEVIIKGIRFLGCTLWTDYQCSDGLSQQQAMRSIEHRIADHSYIHINDKEAQTGYFSTRDAWRIHANSVSWLTKKLFYDIFDGKTIVATHHGPSKLCQHKLFGHTDLSGAFYSELSNLLEKADVWVYGHTHSNLNIKIKNTRLISNQKGYRHEGVSDFNEKFILKM